MRPYSSFVMLFRYSVSLSNSIPRLAWGKYVEENGRKTLYISMELNHRFVDGVHVGKFHEALTELIEAL